MILGSTYGEPEQSHRDHDRAGHSSPHTSLRNTHAVVLLHSSVVVALLEEVEASSDDRTDDKTKERLTDLSTVETVLAAEDKWECLVEKEDNSVDETVVQRREISDWLTEEEDKGPGQSDLEQLLKSLLLGIVVVKVADVIGTRVALLDEFLV